MAYQAIYEFDIFIDGGVVFPDSTGGFNSGKFCDVGHDIHIGKVDDVVKTPR